MTLATAAAQLADIEAALAPDVGRGYTYSDTQPIGAPALYAYHGDELVHVWSGTLSDRDDVSLILEWAERIGPADGCVLTAPVVYARGAEQERYWATVVYAVGNDGLPVYCALVEPGYGEGRGRIELLDRSPILGRLALILATVAVKETP